MAINQYVSWTLFSFVLILQIFSLIPFTFYYAFRRNRPHYDFTLHQSLARKLMYDLMNFYTRVRLSTPLPLTPGILDKNLVTIPPAPPQLYRGPLNDFQIHPTTVSGTWYPAKPDMSSLGNKAREGSGILLHFHGGGYVLGSGRPLDSGYMATILTRHLAPLALFAEYRLSSTSEGRFPAALQDALSAYVFLLDKGVRSQDIIISGDSAGGHLVISLLRYIKEYISKDITAPDFAILWSPWIDVEGAASVMQVRSRRNYHTDYLPARFAEWAVDSFAPANVVDRQGPYITLLHKPFATKTKIWVHVGALEILYEEIKEWVQQMQDVGCNLYLMIEELGTHDLVESGYLNGFNKEAEKASKSAATWIATNARYASKHK